MPAWEKTQIHIQQSTPISSETSIALKDEKPVITTEKNKENSDHKK